MPRLTIDVGCSTINYIYAGWYADENRNETPIEVAALTEPTDFLPVINAIDQRLAELVKQMRADGKPITSIMVKTFSDAFVAQTNPDPPMLYPPNMKVADWILNDQRKRYMFTGYSDSFTSMRSKWLQHMADNGKPPDHWAPPAQWIAQHLCGWETAVVKDANATLDYTHLTNSGWYCHAARCVMDDGTEELRGMHIEDPYAFMGAFQMAGQDAIPVLWGMHDTAEHWTAENDYELHGGTHITLSEYRPVFEPDHEERARVRWIENSRRELFRQRCFAAPADIHGRDGRNQLVDEIKRFVGKAVIDRAKEKPGNLRWTVSGEYAGTLAYALNIAFDIYPRVELKEDEAYESE